MREFSTQKMPRFHAAEICATFKRQHFAVSYEHPTSSSPSPSPEQHQHFPAHSRSGFFKSAFFHILTRGRMSIRVNIRRTFQRTYGELPFSEREPGST